MWGQQSGGWGGAPAATAGAGFGAFGGGGFGGALGGGFGAPAASSSAFGGFGAPATAVSAGAFAFNSAAPSASAAPFAAFGSASSAPSGAAFAFPAFGGSSASTAAFGGFASTVAAANTQTASKPAAAPVNQQKKPIRDRLLISGESQKYAPPVQPFHSSAMYQPSTDKIEYKAFHQYRDDFDTANIMFRMWNPWAPEVNPELYCAFRMPGSVEYIDKDKTKPLMYGAKADDDPPETALKEGEKCPGFPFYANREIDSSQSSFNKFRSFVFRERQDFSEEAEKKFQESRKAWLAATSSEDIKEWYSRHGDVDKDTWEFYPVVGAHALLELMKCQQQRLSTEMTRLKEIKDKQLKQLQSALLGRKIQVQQLLTQHLNLMHEVYKTLLQFDLDPQQWQSQSPHASAYHQEVLKLKEDIEHRLQKQVLALRRVVADVEGSASHAVVSSVKLHNEQRFLEREDEIAKLSNNVLEMNFILARLLKQDQENLL